MRKFSIVVVTDAVDDCLHKFLQATEAQTIGMSRLEIVLVNIGSLDDSDETLAIWQRRHPDSIRLLRHIHTSVCGANNVGMAHATGEWVTFIRPTHIFPANHFEVIDTFLDTQTDAAPSLVSIRPSPEHKTQLELIERMDDMPTQTESCLFRRDKLLSSGVQFDDRVRAGFEGTALIGRFLLSVTGSRVGWIHHDSAPVTCPLPLGLWSDEDTYDSAITHGYLSLLEDATRTGNPVPRWLQRAILRDLQSYFITDTRERAPTRVVTETLAVRFHERMCSVIDYIDIEEIYNLCDGSEAISGHALLSYKNQPCHSPVTATAYDHGQGLARFTYFVHGHRPVETFQLDENFVKPAHAKYRACNFFRRTLYHERIVWLPTANANALVVFLDGKPVPILFGGRTNAASSPNRQSTIPVPLAELRSAFPPRPASPQPRLFGLAGVKARIMRRLARLPPVRKKFANAWVFTDRDYDADDNAEHLYRWVRGNHPEINAWFLLGRDSPDWARLKKEGFRLIPQGWLRHLLLLNCGHIISSHADYATSGFIHHVHGICMTWSFIYLRHGIVIYDQSHWYNSKPFDLLLTCGTAEYEAITGDSTPYTFTSKETCLTGLPRHDALIQKAARTPRDAVDTITVMPTWRASLINESDRGKPTRESMEAFARSDYAQRWGALLRSESLRDLAAIHGMQLVFMPHPDAVPYLDAFDLPKHVAVMTKADIGMQELFCRSAAMITDYSSVIFEMAYLRRPVLYYQYDRDQFYSKEHVWREGYFSCERDGFGPVLTEQTDLLEHLNRILSNNAQPDNEYLERMENFFPYRDGQACRRVFETILGMKQSLAASP